MTARSDDPLLTPVQFVRGVGPVRAELLTKLGLLTAGDLLFNLPRDVLDLSQIVPVFELKANELQTVRGIVVDRDARETSTGKSLVAVLLQSDGGFVRGVWFGQPYMLHKFESGQRVLFSGKPKFHQQRWEFSHPRVQWLGEEDADHGGGLLPRYGLTEGLSQYEMRRLMRNVIDDHAESAIEYLPDALREKAKLPGIAQALHQIHCPTTMEEHRAGMRRVLYEDLLEFQIGVALRRQFWQRDRHASPLSNSAKIDARIRRLFSFRFTAGQDQAVKEIVGDLAKNTAMHRLLQADVGAGKTAVAIYAMLVTVAAGKQVVLMAPTEVLAQQHWQTIDALLAESRVERRLLTGQLTAAQRRDTLAGITNGSVHLVVGTQAVIQESVKFHSLGLAVIDEQHKFGVTQRAKFSLVGEDTVSPHVLVMTATPIPRSLCLTQFGDLDLSVMSELPPGRQRIVTSRIGGRAAARKAWDYLKERLREGRQAYVVCPRVADDESAPVGVEAPSGAEAVFRDLAAGELKSFRVGLVHGQQDRERRATTMAAFRNGELDVLVATTVIEVGVDVPNATLMVILQAERFGLSQLHQLRGRIGRGRFQGYCFLFSEATTPETVKRLAAMEATADGFQIAEADFELRGPGDILGTRQSGDMPLRFADLNRDKELLDEARVEAFRLVDARELEKPEYARLKAHVLDRFAKLMDLPQTG